MRIAISCDENPGDPGAVHNGIVERDVNIKVASALEVALLRCGQAAWFDPSITYTERVARANRDGSQVLVACAHNAAGNANAEGALFIFCGAEAHHIGHQQAAAQNCGAALVAGGLVKRFGTYDEEVVECCDFNGDTVYCELGYETNPSDAATIKQADYPSRAAELLAQGLAKTYGFAYAPPAPAEPEWKANLQKLSEPVSGVLAQPAHVINTISNEPVETLAAGASLTVTYGTSVRGVKYYMTDFSVAHETGFAIAMSDVHLEDTQPAPAPAPEPQPPAPPVPPVDTPPPAPPVNPSPVVDHGPAGARLDFDAITTTLINWFDHELVHLIEMAKAELEKRKGASA